MKCGLCNGPGAKLVNYKAGTLLQCSDCAELGIRAHLERVSSGEEMNVLKPSTFRAKPACSQIWLLAWSQTETRTCQ